MKRFIIFSCGVLTLAGMLLMPARSGAGAPPQSKFKNIKVMTGMADLDIQKEMQAWGKALGVNCAHCHQGSDFASEANPKKEVARKMFTMVKGVNKDFLEGKLSCVLCHRGVAVPDPTQ